MWVRFHIVITPGQTFGRDVRATGGRSTSKISNPLSTIINPVFDGGVSHVFSPVNVPGVTAERVFLDTEVLKHRDEQVAQAAEKVK